MKELKVASVKVNFIFNTLRTLLNFLTPLLVFPYTSRVLGPEGLGSVEFANSIVAYFTLFTALGIPTYGVREIARVRDSLEERSKSVWELTIILLINNIIGYIVYFVLLIFIPTLNVHFFLFCIVCPNILLSDFSYEWFFVGIEDQKYITVRYVITKIIQILLVYILVKNPEHYVRYAAIMVGMNSISTIFNIARLRKYICFVPIKKLNIKRHFKSMFMIFASIVAINIYTNLDITMVGFFKGEEAVGIYAAANKVIRIVIQLVTALGVVMIPRLANCLENNDIENYRKNLWLSLRFVFMIGLPSIVGIELLANEITVIFAGNQYLNSVLSMRLLAPIIIIVGMAHFTGLQVLYSNDKEKYYTIAVSVAAIVNAIFNFIMIPVIGYNGAILGSVLAETIGLVVMSIFARKLLKESKAFGIDLVKYIIASLIMGMFILISMKITSLLNMAISLIINIIVGVLIYFISLLIMKDKCLMEFLKRNK